MHPRKPSLPVTGEAVCLGSFRQERDAANRPRGRLRHRLGLVELILTAVEEAATRLITFPSSPSLPLYLSVGVVPSPDIPLKTLCCVWPFLVQPYMHVPSMILRGPGCLFLNDEYLTIRIFLFFLCASVSGMAGLETRHEIISLHATCLLLFA